MSIKKDVASDILYVQAPEEKHSAIITWLEGKAHISKLEVLDKSSQELFLLVLTAGNQTIIERLNKHNCFLLEPTPLINHTEILIVGTNKRENIANLLESLSEIGDATLTSIQEYSFDSELLTKKQKESLDYAYLAGYYDWPRNVSADELAKSKGLSKSTFLEHLRKAEIKIIKQHIEQPANSR